ncbi:MAG: beta-eliminating lyase-related protein, partial [Proteobacteria bacterium]|nr:beta-eliminating lyase-related protein [Pseudomonadota bacterium]
SGGKLTTSILEEALSKTGSHGEHECLPSTISITQSTEAGTLYSINEIRAIANTGKIHGLSLHMDGARFANALVSMGCTPAEMTWQAGVELLSFGATKNGAMMAEALIVFNPHLAKQIKRLRKRSAHLVSKMRYVSAQLLAYLENNLWLELAKHANEQAHKFYQANKDKIEFIYRVEANEVFCRLPAKKIKQLQKELFTQNYPNAAPSELVDPFAALQSRLKIKNAQSTQDQSMLIEAVDKLGQTIKQQQSVKINGLRLVDQKLELQIVAPSMRVINDFHQLLQQYASDYSVQIGVNELGDDNTFKSILTMVPR